MAGRLSLKINEPVEVIFSFDDFTPLVNDYGEDYRYGVRVGEEKSYIYAPKPLHEILQKYGVKKGTWARITKKPKNAWEVETEGSGPPPVQGQMLPVPDPAPPAQEAPDAGPLDAEILQVHQEHKRAVMRYLQECLAWSKWVLQEEWEIELDPATADLGYKLAFTLFQATTGRDSRFRNALFDSYQTRPKDEGTL